MKPDLFNQLDSLLSELFALDTSLDNDTFSIRSENTENTALTSVLLSPKKKHSSRLVLERSTIIQHGACNLQNVLDCLHDMALQESAQIENYLAEVVDELELCVGMNTYRMDRIFPATLAEGKKLRARIEDRALVKEKRANGGKTLGKK